MYMKNKCLCPHCTASVEEAEWYFGLFCELDITEDCLIVAAPTLHPGTLCLDEEDAGCFVAVASAATS